MYGKKLKETGTNWKGDIGGSKEKKKEKESGWEEKRETEGSEACEGRWEMSGKRTLSVLH